MKELFALIRTRVEMISPIAYHLDCQTEIEARGRDGAMGKRLSDEQVEAIAKLDNLKSRMPQGAMYADRRETIEQMKDSVIRFNRQPSATIVARFEGIALVAAVDTEIED